MVQAMDVTVIVPTYQGASKILSVLRALEKQTFKNFELVVVIDGSTDHTREILKTPFQFSAFRILDIPNKGRSGARNAGASIAMGSILVFYDDDMEPAPSSLEQHVLFQKKYAEVLLSGHPLDYPSRDGTDIQKYKAWLTDRWTQKYPLGISELNSGNPFFTAANCSMKKSTWSTLKGFDERLTDAEDFDLACRALELNIDVYFDKLNVALHHDNITCRSYIKRLREYRKANDKLRMLHPARSGTQSIEAANAKKIAYALLASPTLVKLIDMNNVLKILPRSFRYRLYDAIIFSLSQIHSEIEL
jgi:glycosyltransferase involved in cell wall biosynthesis